MKRVADRLITLAKRGVLLSPVCETFLMFTIAIGTHNAKNKCVAWVRDDEVRKKLYTTIAERYK